MDIAGIVDRIKARQKKDQGRWEKEMRDSRLREIAAVLRQDGVPRRIRHLGPRKNTPALAAVDEWLDDESPWKENASWCLVLSGPPGIGKSVAADSFLHRWAAMKDRKPTAGAQRRWYQGAELQRMSQFTEEFDNLCKLPTLVIDDLGVEYSDVKGNLKSKIDCLLDSRYANQRRTLITTNLSWDEFSSRYGERVADRIRDGGQFLTLHDESMRGKNT